MEMQRSYLEIESDVLNHVSIDYMPLAHLISYVTGCEGIPSETDFLAVTSFLKEFTSKYNIRCVYGCNMVTAPSDLLSWLKTNWKTKSYDDINFSIWFDMDEQDIPSEYRIDTPPAGAELSSVTKTKN